MNNFTRYLFSLIFIITLFFSSCGKNGAVGPTGQTGPTGAIGAVGPAGPAGANGTNGSIIYSGTSVPPGATGVSGDFYIDLSTGFLYGPKTTSGWGTGISLIGQTGASGPAGATGAAGATGVAGSQIYSGSGVPANSLGNNGDYYLDKTNYLLYGPKTSGTWSTPVNLQGPAGSVGPAGPQGPEGNANVKVDTFSVKNSLWLWNSQYSYSTSPGSYTEYFTRYFIRANNTVTQDVLDNGLVLVYFVPNAITNPNQWAPLPYEFTDGTGNFNYNFAFETSVGSVKLHFFFIQLVASATIPTLSTYTIATAKFKIVTVTGQTGTFMLAHHVNLNNYPEVSRVTGLWQQDKLHP